jgi:NADP-dependent 3-hydroxy acid dehydrogenase YdfG
MPPTAIPKQQRAIQLISPDRLQINQDKAVAEPIAEAAAEKWRAVINVNLFGCFWVTKHACRSVKSQGGGSIIHIPRLRPILLHHRHRPERDRRPGNGLT